MAKVDIFSILMSKTFGIEVCEIWNVNPRANIENNMIHAIRINSLDEFFSSRFFAFIFWKEIRLLKIKKNNINPIISEIIPGRIKANFQSKNFSNKPAIKAPEPIPIPPKIPLIPRALPFLLVELTTHAIPTGC